MKKVLHIITGLNQGGAEAVLFRVCKESREKKISFIVISLTDNGFFSEKFEKIGVPVKVVDCRFFFRLPISFWNLCRVIQSEKPDIVQTWMYHADFLGGLAAKIAGIKVIFWNIRGPLNSKKTNLQTHVIARLCALLSKWIPKKIISCSEYAARVHIDLGYKKELFRIIPNGYVIPNLSSFEPKNNFSNSETAVLGMIARYDPYKDHETLLRAMAIVKEKGFSFKWLLVGNGVDNDNVKLVNLIKLLNLEKEINLMGLQHDIPKVIALLDVHVLSSIDEAFPNVVAECMACGVPPVTTDVGDARLIVGDLGWIVQPGDPISLANGIIEAIKEIDSDSWEERKSKCRQRIIEHFSMDKMIDSYTKIWLE